MAKCLNSAQQVSSSSQGVHLLEEPEIAWNSRGFTHSPRLTKYAFQEIKFPRIQKKKLVIQTTTEQDSD